MSDDQQPVCDLSPSPDAPGVQIIELFPDPVLADYLQAMRLADLTAEEILGDYMLLSWYDRDRDFESPQHSSECHQDSAIPGYVDYGIYHGAKLKIDIERGRFVFFYMPIDI